MRVRFGECLLDSETRELLVRGKAVHLQHKAFQFLELLLERRPRVVTKEQIHEELWPRTFVSDSTLTSLLTEIRAAIGDDAHEPRFVRTVHRVGYAFSGAAREARESSAESGGSRSLFWLVRGRRRIPLEIGETIIGRDPAATLWIDDKSISRRHARIRHADRAPWRRSRTWEQERNAASGREDHRDHDSFGRRQDPAGLRAADLPGHPGARFDGNRDRRKTLKPAFSRLGSPGGLSGT